MRLPFTRRRIVLGALVILLVAIAAWILCGPIPSGLLDEGRDTSTVVVDRHGEVLYEKLSEAGTRRMLASADRLPPVLVAATVAA